MSTIKSYTDVSQSKKLAEILPPESADMIWDLTNPDLPTIRAIPYEDSDYNNKYLNIIPCWSLAALLNLCPTINGKQPILTRGKLTRLWYCYYEDEMDTQTYDNPVDAVLEMIQLLHEQKLL